MPDEMSARQAVIETALKMSRMGLSPGRSGNVSCAWREGMLVTPSGIAYGELLPEDIVFVDPQGKSPRGGRKPSSEWPFHLAIYQARKETGAVVHCHSQQATTLASAKMEIPAFHYMVAMAGGKEIPLIPYATFGSKKLASLVVRGLARHQACLMAHHGQIAIGDSLESALELAEQVEILAAQYLQLLAIDAVHLLSDKRMDRILKKFKTYGKGN